MKSGRAYMVCDVNGQPCGQPFATYEEARASARTVAGGMHGYHARPVEISIRVLGSPPEPWCFRAMADGRVVPL